MFIKYNMYGCTTELPKFLAFKHIQKLFSGIGLHYCGPDASFDTHFAIYMFDPCLIAYVSNVAFLTFLT